MQRACCDSSQNRALNGDSREQEDYVFADGVRFSLGSIRLDRYDHSQDGAPNYLADLHWTPGDHARKGEGS